LRKRNRFMDFLLPQVVGLLLAYPEHTYKAVQSDNDGDVFAREYNLRQAEYSKYKKWMEKKKREFIKQLVPLYKQKGTVPGHKKMALLRDIGRIQIRELYKSILREHGMWSALNDEAHPFKSARVDILVCETQCETFAEFTSDIDEDDSFDGTTSISHSRAREIFENELNDFRPIHVLLRPLIEHIFAESTFFDTVDSFSGSTIRIRLEDTVAVSDEFDADAACVATCETVCQLCEEEVCFFTCQLGSCTTSCQLFCELDCQLNSEKCPTQKGCVLMCETETQTGCTLLCELNCQLPVEIR